MENIEYLNWLKGKGLYDYAKDASIGVKRVFTQCLFVKDEQLLIIGDRGNTNCNVAAVLSGAYFLAATQLNIGAKIVLQDVKAGTEPADQSIISSLSGIGSKNIIVLNMSDKLGGIDALGKSFRKFCKKMDHRFVSAMGLGALGNEKIKEVVSAIDTNYKVMQDAHSIVKSAFDNAEEINIKTTAGTNLHYNVKGIKAISADGKYAENGSGGNIPAGEVYIPPNGKRVEGMIVIDGSSRNKESTTLIKELIRIKVEDGSITEITGGIEAEMLRKTIEWAEGNSKNPGSVRRICELGVGLNPNAKIIGATVVDDKSLGTAHIGIGSNYWFGGSIYANVHLDQVFRNPEIYLDGERFNI